MEIVEFLKNYLELFYLQIFIEAFAFVLIAVD